MRFSIHSRELSIRAVQFSRTLPILRIKVDGGKLVVADIFVGYVGVKGGNTV